PPRFAPNMCCYTNNDIKKDLKKYLSASQFKRFNELACFASYTHMPKYHVKAHINRCAMVREVWLYECCSQVNPKVSIKVANQIPRLLNWKTNDDHPLYETLMQGIFSDVNNLLSFLFNVYFKYN
ncbi:hypothetical protein HAX54_019783, partial [Datura stramonium]|nr:hypothetical protein [Datura stramonium]